jgi:DNA invertase Pin-like site-specific DNA recombinase
MAHLKAAGEPLALPRYVDLVRVSGAAQVERDTPATQKRQLDGLAAHRPGVLVKRIEFDFNVSATKDIATRADMMELAALARTRAFDEVRVVSIDRLTRHADLRQRAWVWGVIADAGAKIVDTNGHVIDPENDMGEIDYYLQTLFASREARKIAEKTRAGKARVLAEGGLAEGTPPYARRYDKKARRWSTDPEELKIYQRLFEMVAGRGMSVKRVADQLNDDGVQTKYGKAWHPASVSRLIHSRAAIGEYSVRDTVIQIPPVVDRATFDAAQLVIDGNRRERSGAPPSYEVLLRKLLVCDECGGTLHVHYARDRRVKGGGEAFYYVHKQPEECRRFHRAQVVDDAVKELVAGFLRRPDSAELLTRRRASKGGELESAKKATKEAERELRDLDRQEENLTRMRMKEKLTAGIAKKLASEIARNRAVAEAALAGAKATAAAASRANVTVDAAERRIAALRAMVDGEDVPTTSWRRVVELLFPQTPTTGLRLAPDGALDAPGIVTLDEEGEAELRSALDARSQRNESPDPVGKLSQSSRAA